MRAVSHSLALLIALCVCLALSTSIRAQTISQPQASLPVQSLSDDPNITTGSSYSAALCSLHAILGTESAHGIGPLTVQPNCMSMTLQPHSSATVNGQTLPSSGIVTIFQPTSSEPSLSKATPTTAPRTSTSASSSSTGSSSASSSTAAPRQTNAGQVQSRPPAAASWIAKHNIGVILFTTFALLAGVTYFLDELLTLLV
ncbi:uncharacterized protein SPSC_03271 [Sporisorium scitamineum]|uniref:Uncharacterized protein n=1 Tax=Sporisorium scitamineum TaxID=49012 RepID=A0A0F7SDU3_9BASI|nr:uncharacterized protein SPSC_03271 [Sporisorium scitamineum]CDW99433.1 hypothetical protein [Sporisorium scitamineum]